MAKNTAPVSGPGPYAKRVDLSKSSQIERMGSGKYGEVKNLKELRQAESTDVNTVQPTDFTPKVDVPNFGAFDPTQRPQEEITAGVGFGTPGPGPEAIVQPPDSVDPASVYIRALYMSNPTPQTRRVLEMFYNEGR